MREGKYECAEAMPGNAMV